ncbi:MAG: ABC transporter ATP-binding protein/permease, partial [Deltaproteobacteria bacterium]|nr:ABC transporter ATP-binding protein/permease [Deltaproteobacteria bacterium]
MQPGPAPIGRLTRARFSRAVRQFATSEVGGKARALFASLLALMLGINALNVVSSYVGRNFMTAIANRDMAQFRLQVLLYVAVFGVCTVVAVFQRYTEERLGLLWRAWLTQRLVTIYLEHPIYYRLTDHVLENGEIANPDQRIAEDVRVFTATTLSFVLMLLNGIFTAVAFSGVLWSISPGLFGVAVVYAAVGSFLTIALGRRLIGLNSRQLDQEADFRAELIHLRENAESVALLRHEGRLRERILRPLGELTANLLAIIGVNRKLGFFTTGYNYLIQIIPALLVAPLFIRGEVEFGVITQSAMAFSALLGAFSLIITQFQSISAFAAVISRLGDLAEAAEQAQSASASAIEMHRSQDHLEYGHLTLTSRRDRRVLVRDLRLSVARGTRLLVLGPEGPKVALFRATAGIWDSGNGSITCPDAASISFLAERPYLPPGTLREFLV